MEDFDSAYVKVYPIVIRHTERVQRIKIYHKQLEKHLANINEQIYDPKQMFTKFIKFRFKIFLDLIIQNLSF